VGGTWVRTWVWTCVQGCARACVRACMRACTRACRRACTRACMRACVREDDRYLAYLGNQLHCIKAYHRTLRAVAHPRREVTLQVGNESVSRGGLGDGREENDREEREERAWGRVLRGEGSGECGYVAKRW
jgi:hypothetical protein